MKIHGSGNTIYNNPRIHRPNAASAATTAAATQPKAATTQKVNIPKDFEMQQTLTRQEQAFFEKLYPKARKDIQKYMQAQNAAPVQKGQFIDVRG